MGECNFQKHYGPPKRALLFQLIHYLSIEYKIHNIPYHKTHPNHRDIRQVVEVLSKGVESRILQSDFVSGESCQLCGHVQNMHAN